MALAIDLTALLPAPRAVVANLPYNVATPLLIGWLRQIAANPGSFARLVLMFQKEVAERIAAAAGERRLWAARRADAMAVPGGSHVRSCRRGPLRRRRK